MSGPPSSHKASPCRLPSDDDILNDSISIELDDDSFDGNQSTLRLSHPDLKRSVPGPYSTASTDRPISSQSSQATPLHRSQSTPIHNEEDRMEGTSAGTQARHPSTTALSDRWVREQQRNDELEQERDWLKEMNGMLERAADEMDKIKDKFENVQAATETSHELLDLYRKILTQTEHTKDLLSNPSWQGLTADVQRRAEARKQEEFRQAKLREQEREEQLLKEQQEQAALEAERLRQSQQPRPTRGGIMRGRASTAGRTLRGKSRIGRIVR